MAIYTFDIPDKLAEWILAEKNINPQTYIQNKFIDSIVAEYEEHLGETKKAKAQVDTKSEITDIKKKIEVKIETKVK